MNYDYEKSPLDNILELLSKEFLKDEYPNKKLSKQMVILEDLDVIDPPIEATKSDKLLNTKLIARPTNLDSNFLDRTLELRYTRLSFKEYLNENKIEITIGESDKEQVKDLLLNALTSKINNSFNVEILDDFNFNEHENEFKFKITNKENLKYIFITDENETNVFSASFIALDI